MVASCSNGIPHHTRLVKRHVVHDNGAASSLDRGKQHCLQKLSERFLVEGALSEMTGQYARLVESNDQRVVGATVVGNAVPD